MFHRARAVADLVHIRQNSPQLLQLGIIQRYDLLAVLVRRHVCSEHRQHILPRDGHRIVRGYIFHSVVRYCRFNPFELPVVFLIQRLHCLLQRHAFSGRFGRKENAERRTCHQSNQTDEQDDAQRKPATRRQRSYKTFGRRNTGFGSIGQRPACRPRCFQRNSCSLLCPPCRLFRRTCGLPGGRVG